MVFEVCTQGTELVAPGEQPHIQSQSLLQILHLLQACKPSQPPPKIYRVFFIYRTRSLVWLQTFYLTAINGSDSRFIWSKIAPVMQTTYQTAKNPNISALWEAETFQSRLLPPSDLPIPLQAVLQIP